MHDWPLLNYLNTPLGQDYKYTARSVLHFMSNILLSSETAGTFIVHIICLIFHRSVIGTKQLSMRKILGIRGFTSHRIKSQHFNSMSCGDNYGNGRLTHKRIKSVYNRLAFAVSALLLHKRVNIIINMRSSRQRY